MTSVSAYAQGSAGIGGSHPSGFHPVIPHIHHPQPLPFPSMLHPGHHHPHAQGHHPGHHSHLLGVPPPNNDFYKNAHIMNNIVPNLSHPSIHSHMTSAIPIQTSTALTAPSCVTSNHSTISHQSHYSPKSSTSTIEPSQDSVSPPLIVDNLDNVASPISVSSNSNNNNNINSNQNHKNGETISNLNNNKCPENSNKQNGDLVTLNANSLRNSLRSEANNSLMDILMNPDKCQVNNYFLSIYSFQMRIGFGSYKRKTTMFLFRNSFTTTIRCFSRRYQYQAQQWICDYQHGKFYKKQQLDSYLWLFVGYDAWYHFRHFQKTTNSYCCRLVTGKIFPCKLSILFF